jgi:ribosome maturation factor RimP
MDKELKIFNGKKVRITIYTRDAAQSRLAKDVFEGTVKEIDNNNWITLETTTGIALIKDTIDVIQEI